VPKKNEKTFIIALGGSIVAPDGVDIWFVSKFRAFIKKYVKRGFSFYIVIGGGARAREYQRTAEHLAPQATQLELDTIGMRATRLNAELVRVAFGNHTHPEVVENPERLIYVRSPIAIAAGWMPGYSTDTVAVRLAEELGIKRIIVAGRPDYVYDRDFVRVRGAKPIKRLSWKQYLNLVGKTWRPGMSTPVDPVAAQRAERMGLEAIVVRGTRLENLERVFRGEKFRGTVISDHAEHRHPS
jgi:uridylate kinase